MARNKRRRDKKKAEEWIKNEVKKEKDENT